MRVVGPPRLRVPFLVERQLLAEEQVLRSQVHVRREAQPNERDEVAKQLADRGPQ
jgi:hypothetical protein